MSQYNIDQDKKRYEYMLSHTGKNSHFHDEQPKNNQNEEEDKHRSQIVISKSTLLQKAQNKY